MSLRVTTCSFAPYVLHLAHCQAPLPTKKNRLAWNEEELVPLSKCSLHICLQIPNIFHLERKELLKS
jgi:hypothetical protein